MEPCLVPAAIRELFRTLASAGHATPAASASLGGDWPAIPPPSQPEAAAGENDVRLQAVWAFAGDAMALSDPEGVLLAVNPVYYALYGYAPAELLGQCF